MGGDEFMIVIENARIHKAARYVSIKILSALNQPISVEGQLLSVGASVGIALFPDHGPDAHTLLKNSDMAMYHAKESGKNRFEFYNEKLAQ
jgi:diguanylate cyclase (GGDEF)-like protein